MQYCLFRTVVELDYNVTLACGIVWVSGVVTPSSTGSVHQRNWLSQHKTQSPLPLQSHAPSTQKLMAFRRQETEPCLRESQGRPWGHQSSITQINDWLNSKSESLGLFYKVQWGLELLHSLVSLMATASPQTAQNFRPNLKFCSFPCALQEVS